jgi:tRNA(Ile)-lysidine synthase TilS/MesJ
MKMAREACRDWGVELHEITFKQITRFPLDELVPMIADVNPCAICGVFRRSGLNEVAKAIGAEKLATGHNLDDLAQSILMNILNSDMDKLFRLGPHKNTVPFQ